MELLEHLSGTFDAQKIFLNFFSIFKKWPKLGTNIFERLILIRVVPYLTV